MNLPGKKTKIVCTVGPACDTQPVLEDMIRNGMNIARLNFAHGDFDSHAESIGTVRRAAEATGEPVTILADLPGPKMRIGALAEEPVELERGAEFTLFTREITGDATKASISFEGLTDAVKPGDPIFLNDGYIQLVVRRVTSEKVVCEVAVGGPLLSHKGVNFPGIDLGIRAFTEFDHACLEFAIGQGVHAVSQSFVSTAADIDAVRQAARERGADMFIIAKIERTPALENYDAILKSADGIMVARGDLGVEVPVERVAVVQKDLIHRANLHARPVITATQMLESMTEHTRPTRAEVSDVTNAILDGSDAVMLSGESAVGAHPANTVATMARIVKAAEASQHHHAAVRRGLEEAHSDGEISNEDLISLSVSASMSSLVPQAVISPARTGISTRRLARFRLPAWIIAVAASPAVFEAANFCYGVYPVYEPEPPADWETWTRHWLNAHGMDTGRAVLTQRLPSGTNRMEIVTL